MTFTELKHQRLRAGLLQYELAFHARINPARLSQIENGRAMPTAREKGALAAVLQVPESCICTDGMQEPTHHGAER